MNFINIKYAIASSSDDPKIMGFIWLAGTTRD